MPISRLQVHEEVQDLRAHRDVERGDRLVEHDQVRPRGDGAGDATRCCWPPES